MQPLVPGFVKAFYPNSNAHYIFPIGYEQDALATDRRTGWIAKQERISKSAFVAYLNQHLADFGFDETLIELIKLHGLFAEWILRYDKLFEIHGVARASAMDPEKFRQLYFAARYLESSPSAGRSWTMGHVGAHTYRTVMEQLIYRATQSAPAIEALTGWYEQRGGSRFCALCGRSFNLIDIPYAFYVGSTYEDQCCFECPIVASPSQDELAMLVPRFVEACGFVPNADALPIAESFTVRIPANKRLEVFVRFAEMGGLRHAKQVYGSWFEALAHTGVLPGGVQITKRGIRCLAQDGHVCRSLDEQHIDNWLYQHDLEHECEPPYPVHPELNPKGGLRADWQVGEAFIEYFGLVGDPAYDAKTAGKLALAQAVGIPLIAIYPRDMLNLGKVLGQLRPKH